MFHSDLGISVLSPHEFTVVAYKTEAEAQAWFAGQRDLFDRVETWLADNLVHPYVFDREPFSGVCEVWVSDPVEVMAFTLRWGGHLADKDAPPWLF